MEESQIKMPEANSFLLSSSPHLHDNSSTAKIMLQVIACMVPMLLAGIWYFGWDALRVMAGCTVFSVAAEYFWNRIRKVPQTVGDCSAALTGLILAVNLPANAPMWLCAVGSVFAIILCKQVYGGLGQNPFNPAAAARVALLVGFAGPMTHFPDAKPGAIFGLAKEAVSSATTHAADAMSGATPLTAAKAAMGNLEKMNALPHDLMDLFLGNHGGTIGETCVLAILIGAIGLLILRLIRWQIPIAILVTVFVFTGLVHLISPATTPGPAFHLMSGGLLIGAFFMATDTVTSPLTAHGGLLFGMGIGIIVSVIRIWGAYPEGMSFAILIMNALVPLIDKVCYQRPFGWVPIPGGRS